MHQMKHKLLSLALLMGIVGAANAADDSVHYSLEVYQGAKRIVATELNSNVDEITRIALADSGSMSSISMGVHPYIDKNKGMLTTFDFNGADAESLSVYKQELDTSSSDVIFIPVWNIDTKKQYLVKMRASRNTAL